MRKFLLAGLLALPVVLGWHSTAQAQRIVFSETRGPGPLGAIGAFSIFGYRVGAVNIGPGLLCGAGPIYNYGPFTSTPSWACAGGGYAGIAGYQTPSAGPPCGPWGCRTAAPAAPPPGGPVLPASYSPFVPPGHAYPTYWPGAAVPGASSGFGG
jgi:hypothetical protein